MSVLSFFFLRIFILFDGQHFPVSQNVSLSLYHYAALQQVYHLCTWWCFIINPLSLILFSFRKKVNLPYTVYFINTIYNGSLWFTCKCAYPVINRSGWGGKTMQVLQDDEAQTVSLSLSSPLFLYLSLWRTLSCYLLCTNAGQMATSIVKNKEDNYKLHYTDELV